MATITKIRRHRYVVDSCGTPEGYRVSFVSWRTGEIVGNGLGAFAPRTVPVGHAIRDYSRMVSAPQCWCGKPFEAETRAGDLGHFARLWQAVRFLARKAGR